MSRKFLPAWITRIFYCRPRINTVDRKKDLPADLAGKSHRDTVEPIKTKLSDAMAMRCLLDDGEGPSLSRDESREV